MTIDHPWKEDEKTRLKVIFRFFKTAINLRIISIKPCLSVLSKATTTPRPNKSLVVVVSTGQPTGFTPYPDKKVISDISSVRRNFSALSYRELFPRPRDVGLHQIHLVTRPNLPVPIMDRARYNRVDEPGFLRQEKPFGSRLSFHLAF